MLLDIIGASFLVVTFTLCMIALRLVPAAKRIFAMVDEAADIMAEIDRDDREKEMAFKRLTFKLLGRLAHIVFGSVICVAVPMAGLWGVEQLGWLQQRSVLAFSFSWQFVIGTLLIFSFVFSVKRRFSQTRAQAKAFDNNYSALDQTLHKAAFALRSSQIGLAKCEDKLFLKTTDQTPDRPIFITALPRAGTTLLLDLLYETGEFGTHTYRHMPFLQTPLFWNGLSRYFRRDGVPRKRAHGDGMLVSIDSPEAFEEIIWCSFWQKHYRKDHIMPWAGKRSYAEFDQFYRNHIRKILYLTNKDKPSLRYVSKNNLNIARISYLKKVFPDAVIIVPVRHPLQQAYSLWNQHKHFCKIHKEDEFARRYMRDIGHFDFGLNLKPIKFPGGLPGENSGLATEQFGFWLEYWQVTYSALQQKKDLVQFFDYDHFCHNSCEDAAELGKRVGVQNLELLQQLAQRVTAKEPRQKTLNDQEKQLLNACMVLYQDVCHISLNHHG